MRWPPTPRVERLGLQTLERGKLGLRKAFGQRPLPMGEAALAA